jgi:hypothetical protein
MSPIRTPEMERVLRRAPSEWESDYKKLAFGAELAKANLVLLEKFAQRRAGEFFNRDPSRRSLGRFNLALFVLQAGTSGHEVFYVGAPFLCNSDGRTSIAIGDQSEGYSAFPIKGQEGPYLLRTTDEHGRSILGGEFTVISRDIVVTRATELSDIPSMIAWLNEQGGDGVAKIRRNADEAEVGEIRGAVIGFGIIRELEELGQGLTGQMHLSIDPNDYGAKAKEVEALREVLDPLVNH